jgi:hypothetical protein
MQPIYLFWYMILFKMQSSIVRNGEDDNVEYGNYFH